MESVTIKFPKKYHHFIKSLNLTYRTKPTESYIIPMIIYTLRSKNMVNLEKSKDIKHYLTPTWRVFGSTIDLTITQNIYENYEILLEMILAIIDHNSNMMINEGKISLNSQNLPKTYSSDFKINHITEQNTIYILDSKRTEDLLIYNRNTINNL